MAERNQIGGALGRLDAGDARDAEHVALRQCLFFFSRRMVAGSAKQFSLCEWRDERRRPCGRRRPWSPFPRASRWLNFLVVGIIRGESAFAVEETARPSLPRRACEVEAGTWMSAFADGQTSDVARAFPRQRAAGPGGLRRSGTAYAGHQVSRAFMRLGHRFSQTSALSRHGVMGATEQAAQRTPDKKLKADVMGKEALPGSPKISLRLRTKTYRRSAACRGGR